MLFCFMPAASHPLSIAQPKIFGLGLTGTGTPQLKSALIAIGLNDVVLADQTLVPYLFDDVSTYNFTGLVMMILFH